MLYLEVHNKKDGIKRFGAETTYDFYCLHNVPNTMFTRIKCMDGTIQRVDISKMEFIPNGMYNMFQNLVAKNKSDRVNFIGDSSYHTQREYVSNEQTNEFNYPCVYMIRNNGDIEFKYSNNNKNGHFGIPKVIFGNGRANPPVVDKDGKYGMTQFAFAIVDDVENLERIKEAMLNPEFIKLMYYSGGNNSYRYNKNIIATFRKDFWKEFLE